MTAHDDRAWDDLTPPTQEELEQAQALREALEGEGENPDAELLRSLRLVQDPPELDPRVNEWLVRRALHRAMPASRGKLWVASGVGAALALAAGVALVLSSGPSFAPSVPAEASLIPSRSTQPLFDEPFERHGGTSSRMDRIARERARDYRSNLFLRRGVQP
jgi:hypothetical protein